MVLANGQARSYYAAGEASEETCDDDVVDELCVHQPEKKRRLTFEQVKLLDKSFEEDNKLEPDRKLQLAKDLNLQPRQVAVWFQNRRARWKTKQLEKDYVALKLSYDSLKSDYDALLREKELLQKEVSSLTFKLEEIPPKEHLNLVLESDTIARNKDPNDSKDESGSPCILAESYTVKEHAFDDEKREASASSGSEESAVCEVNSPRPIDSGLSKEGVLISTSTVVDVVEAAAEMMTTSTEDIECVKVIPQGFHHFVKTEIEDDETYGSYYFTMDADQGAFPWWNVSWP